jgi:hypothetical protein
MEAPPVAELLHPGSLFYVVTVIIHEAKEKNRRQSEGVSGN